MIINTFPKIVKDILKELPKNDYPVLNTRLFFECWLSYILDGEAPAGGEQSLLRTFLIVATIRPAL